MRRATISAVLALLLLPACAGGPKPAPSGHTGLVAPQIIATASPLQCVPYARDKSGIQIRGDADEWWSKAAGQYRRSREPAIGAVLVLKGYAGANRGHLAVVRRVVDSRTLIADHANWLNRGEIQIGTPIVDVSAANDWSEVRVWHTPSRQLGQRTYGVEGFILPEAERRPVAHRTGNGTHAVALASSR